jgi:hypothetical protein
MPSPPTARPAPICDPRRRTSLAMKLLPAALAACGVLGATPAMANEAELKAQIAALQKQLAAQGALLTTLQARLEADEARLNAAAGAAAGTGVVASVQTTASSQPTPAGGAGGSAVASAAVPTTIAAAPPPPASAELPPAPPPAESEKSTTIGGYGEAAFNGYTHDGSRNQADLRRFVLFLGHRFSDRLSFNGEIEWEHAVSSASDRGETEIEQAYLDYQLTKSIKLKAGLFLMPFGFLNTAHEPPVFYGVERNEVETRIIPSTWREGGIGITGDTRSGLSWDVGVTTGFDLAKLDDASAPLAASHQELQLAHAESLSYYGAVNWHGAPGLVVGGGVFSGDSFHANADHRADPTQPDFAGLSGRVTLWDVHARWQGSNWDLQALYTRGTVDQAGQIDSVLTDYNAANGTERPYVPGAFYGWLVQGAYTVWRHNDATLAPFVRYEEFDTQAEMPAGFLADPANADRVVTFGFSLRPLPEVVFKADYQSFLDHPANNRFNLGLGYMF